MARKYRKNYNIISKLKYMILGAAITIIVIGTQEINFSGLGL